MVNISKIFITHMHADHCLGVVAIMAVIMSGVGQTPEGLERLRQLGLARKPDLELYGPVGLRELIRMTLLRTKITLSGVYAVHELIPEGDLPSLKCHLEHLHVNEAVGRDIYPNDEGVWEHVVDEAHYKGHRGWRVTAGPLIHRGRTLT